MRAGDGASELADDESRFLLEGVPWSAYTALRDSIAGAGVRMTYLEGRLELMSPSGTHEEEKSLIARLLEAWADERDVDLRGFGSTTFRRKAIRRGLEPDECYFLGPRRKGGVPQIAIEVLVSNPLVDKLDVYRGLGIAEVWLWRSADKQLEVQVLGAKGYELRTRSRILPELDLELLARFVRPGESHTALTKAYRVELRSLPSR